MRLEISVGSHQIPEKLTVKVNRSGMEKEGESVVMAYDTEM